jgi:hypothetical protein
MHADGKVPLDSRSGSHVQTECEMKSALKRTKDTVNAPVRAMRCLRAAATLAAALSFVFLASVLPAEATPKITLMTPQNGPVGTTVVIVGSGFGTSQGASTVTFNGTPVTWVTWSATALYVQVPAGASSGNVVVKVSGVASNAKSFTVEPSPVITSLSPTSGPVGATITISGSNFTAGGTTTPQVFFEPVLYASPISSTDTSITVAVPTGTVTGDLLVVVDDSATSNGLLFTVTSSDPSISALSPSGGTVGTSVTVTGSNFGSSQGASTVAFNGTTGPPTSWSATSIKVPVPTGATTGDVVVTVGGVQSNQYAFEVGTAAPNITSVSPTSGAVGTSVTIKGTGFGSSQGTSTVSFNGVSGVPSSWSATQIKVPVPAGATSGSVVVTSGIENSNSVSFTVPGTGPSITNLSPSSGPVGTSVTITGTNFGVTQETGTVTFGGTAATATGWSPTSIVATVPSGATSGSVVVTVGGNASNGFSFTVAPSITTLSPTSGAVGATVTITGTTFGSSQGTSTVTFNGTTATPTSWGASSITVAVPTGAATGNVVVTVGGVSSNGLQFTVAAVPTISSLSPSSASAGALVQAIGQNLSAVGQQTTVNIGNLQITNVHVSSDSTSAYFVVPQGSASGGLVVNVGGQASNSLPFTLLTPPQIYALSPLEIAPNAVLTIVGTYFGANGASGNSLLIDGQSTTFLGWSSTQITVQAPSASGAHTVAIVTGGNQSASLQFTVLSYGSISGTVTSGGSAVSGATVQGVAGQSATTDSGGNFSFSSVPAGTYSVGATAAGYVPSIVGQIVVSAGSNTSVQIQLALPNPTQISIVPNGVTVNVGGGQSLSLVDQNGMPVTGATWSVDNSTIGFIDTTDNSIAGVTAGTTTVRAAWQGYQASIPVNVTTSADVLWSSQTNEQQGPALPLTKTGTGPDFVYTDGSNLYGVSYDSGVLWQQSLQGLPTFFLYEMAADENGDFVIPGYDPTSYALTITKFFGTNGLPEWTHVFDLSVVGYLFAVDSQGNVFVGVQALSQSGLQKLSSSNGQASVLQPFSNDAYGQAPFVNQPTVLSDGSAQVQYEEQLSTSVAAVAVHLATFLPSGTATDVVLDSTVLTLCVSGVSAISALNLPDGNGGTVNIWEEETITAVFTPSCGSELTSGTIFLKDSTTGTTYQSRNALYGVDFSPSFVLGSTGLLYFLASQMSCGALGSCGPTIIAMNLTTGTEAWRVPLADQNYPNWSGTPYSTLVAATSDGGVVITGSAGVARIDINGNVTPDSDLSPYLPTSGILSYLGGPDGTLWASSTTSAAVVSDAVDGDTTDGDTVSDYPTPSGKANAFRAELNAHFKDASANLCGGFDGKPGPGKHAPAILVVPVNRSNQVLLKIKGAWQNYTLKSDTSTVTFTPPAPTGNNTTFTINGGSTATLARIKVYDPNGNRQATLRVAVKAQQSKTLDLYPVTDPNNNLVGNAPSSADVSTELQSILGTYANISFTVNPMQTISVHYDLNNDGMLQVGTGPQSESQVINNYIAANNGAPGDIWVSYVKDTNPHSREGFTVVNPTSNCGNAEYIRNNADLSLNGQPWVTAHETGHALCLVHNTKDTNDLMTPYHIAGTGPCRLHEAEWHVLNPTVGEDQPPSAADQ